MTLGETASLIIAYSDLMVVQSITKAINANLPKTGPLGTIPESARKIDRSPSLHTSLQQVSTRQSHHLPVETITARRCERQVDRYEPSAVRPPVEMPVCIEPDKSAKSVIQPVWATLPPVAHVTAERVVKVVHQKVDLIARGSLLDLFV